MPDRMNHDSANSPESQLIGGAIQQNKQKVARADPITYVSKDDPPFLILHGDRDSTVPPNQSQLLYDALKKAGVEAKLHFVKGAGHGFRDREADEMMRAFFDRHVKGTK
jgi:dipeptidyl aminopeptidase/acylaminoacyl peptidase